MPHAYKIAGVVAMLACLSATADGKVLKGDYTVRYFSGPTHIETSDLCVTFVQTGAVAGFPDSGTWSVPSFGSGDFVVDQNVIRFYGTIDNGQSEINHNATVTGATAAGGFDVWNISAVPVTPLQDGTIQMQRGCA